MKTIKTMILTVAFLLIGSISAWAGSWALTDSGYQYKNDDGSCLINTWVQDNGKWYFLGADGLMAVNTTVEGYQLGADGAETTGVATIVTQFTQVVLPVATEGTTKAATTQTAVTGADKSTANTTAKIAETQATSDKSINYVLNKNTKKFHKPSCSSVKDMATKNRKDSTGSREEIVASGYQACKRCNP